MRNEPYTLIRVVVAFFSLSFILAFSLHFHIANPTLAETTDDYRSALIHINETQSKVEITKPNPNRVKVASERKNIEIEKQKEEERKQQEREDKIQRTINFLARNGSPVANRDIAELIVDLSAQNGADFRVILAIMGVESGFCNASFSYNCFGYLNGAKYSSFYNAFIDLVPKVSAQYAVPYGWNFTSLAKAYGMHNYTYHATNMQAWASSI